MMENQTALKNVFLKPETRDGYFISSEMKAAWKEMLDITEEIVRICENHELAYTLAGGTLLGAIRHRGFIPWDDDIDLNMPRRDYDRLLEILPNELKKPYVLQTPVTDPGRCSTFAQIRNPQTTGIDPYWARVERSRFNMGIGVDIFPIDGVPNGLFAWMRTFLFVNVSQWILKWAYFTGRCTKYIAVRKLMACPLAWIIGRERLWRIREWGYALNKMEKCKQCGEFSFQPRSNRTRWSPNCYEKYLTVPFEYLNLKVPVGYDEILTAKYGDWHKPSKFGGYHDEPLILDVTRSYKLVLVERFNYKKEWLTKLP